MKVKSSTRIRPHGQQEAGSLYILKLKTGFGLSARICCPGKKDEHRTPSERSTDFSSPVKNKAVILSPMQDILGGLLEVE